MITRHMLNDETHQHAPEEKSTVNNDLEIAANIQTSFSRKLKQVNRVSAYIKIIINALRDCEQLIARDIPESDRNEMFYLIDQVNYLVTKLSKLYITHKFPKSKEETQEKKVEGNDD